MAVALALSASACGGSSSPAGPGAPAPAAGAWEKAQMIADAGEVPLSECGLKDPPCRRYMDDRYYPALALNERGQAVAAWHRNEDGFRLRAARFVPGSGWARDELVSGAAGSFEHRLALAADGTAAAAWNWYVPDFDLVTRAGREGAAGSTAPPGGGWSREQALGGAYDRARALEVGSDGQGVALLARECKFYDPACTWGDVLAAHVRGGEWAGYESVRRKPSSPCEEISAYDRTTAVAPRGGTAVAVWMEYDRGSTTFSCNNGTQRLMSSRFEGGWTAAARLDETETWLGSLQDLSVAADAQGGAMVAYLKTRSYDDRGVFALRYVPGRGWQPPEALGAGARTPRLALDRDGNALVVWSGSDRKLHGRWFDARTAAWAPEQTLPGTDGVVSTDFAIAIGGARLGLAAWTIFEWQGDDPRGTVMANLFAGAGWKDPVPIQAADHWTAVSPPSLAMDPSGNAIAAWAESDRAFVRIWANRFVAASP